MVASIKAPTLIINGDQDVVLPEHALYLSRLIGGARLLIVPGTHGSYIGELLTAEPGNAVASRVAATIIDFLDQD